METARDMLASLYLKGETVALTNSKVVQIAFCVL